MRILIWIMLIGCLLGTPLMLLIFIRTGNPMSAVNAIWAVGLALWAGWYLKQTSEEK